MSFTLALVLAETSRAQTGGSDKETPLGVLSVTGGKVQGIPTDVDGVTLFKGLPYAGPASGRARFGAPTPVKAWEGVKTADTWPDRSMQWSGINPTGEFWGDEFYYDQAYLPPISENGAALNIFTPAKSGEAKLPVYLWIHGGANAHGYGSEMEFWASKLAEKGIVVVTAQYRLGVFGEMALKEITAENSEGYSGNQRDQDLIAALHWVHDNISQFGGDPQTVTIGGQSAGSRNVYGLLRAAPAKGLFKRAVMQSTFRIGPADEAPADEAEQENAAALEKIFGKPMSLSDLRALPAERFFQPVSATDDRLLYYALRSAINGDTIDGKMITEESVDLMRDGALDGIDILTGANADERTSLDGGPEKTLAIAEYAAWMEDRYGPEWQKVYPADDPSQAYRLKLRAGADEVLAEAMISARYAKSHNSNNNVWVYYFDNPPPGRNSEFYGSFHSSELWYYFNSLRDIDGQRPWTEKDYRMADTMSSYLANFVKTGNPNGDGLAEWKQPEDGPEMMRFNDGYAYPVSTTPYPTRDELNRELVLKRYGLDAQRLNRP
ncbi:para-nitrobenzyl esterase [Pseudorhizobium tarimense]|uniref:Carboxylic ester hydrolase n=1 Tax=Pseudorhizobium tarimense TaxID=1079109 RepID=A0ABV2HBK5_9HYPH|nr:carboxylesterase family protein [Pseudorhizobium tarimense]MCJ8520910.1 carboxylesterase family protein [Pseudorhizobium tarimense]